jgi:hypothetical protein
MKYTGVGKILGEGSHTGLNEVPAPILSKGAISDLNLQRVPRLSIVDPNRPGKNVRTRPPFASGMDLS